MNPPASTSVRLVDASKTIAAASGNGWYLAHANSTDERTASSAFLNDGCVLWSTLKPNPSVTLACGGTLPLTSQVAYGGVLIEPGAGPVSSTTGVNDMLGTVHWLDVPPDVHDCRHAGNCNN